MPDPASQTSTQIANIEAATGRTVAQFAEEIRAAQLSKHGEIVAHLKNAHGLTHGNANALAHAARAIIAGGAPSAEELMAGQYTGGKAALRPLAEAVIAAAAALGDDVSVVVQKTGVSLRSSKQFALVQAASASRLTLALNLDDAMGSPRVVPTPNAMCSHRVDLVAGSEVDAEIRALLAAAYERTR